MRPEAAAFLWDVRNAADRVSSFIEGVTQGEYLGDDLRRSAVERQLEIIGEALNNLRRLDPDMAASIPEVHRIIGLRNVLAHGYAVVDDKGRLGRCVTPSSSTSYRRRCPSGG
ncbi:MAG: hypothetical protein CMH35_03580 [Microbacterium sp.]|nr:hypothetical protein [Microbacterium sp.]|tara:strand:+ start:40238 stop:40576 length:339 start_codon:yes stop_codon:yes gene_type:complete